MSSLKPPQQRQQMLENHVCGIVNTTFPEFKCTITDIRFPKKDFVLQFYTFILEQLNFNLHKIMVAPIENQMKGVSHPEVYMETAQLFNLSKVLKTFFNTLHGRDRHQFGLDDLVEPTSSRNTAFMFDILNFFNFADTRVGELAVKLDVVTERKKTMEDYLERREKLSRELNQRALSKGKREDAAKEVKTKRLEVDEMKRETASLEQMSEKKHSELEDVKRHHQRVQSEIAQLRADHQKLEAQQVQSPDILKSNYKHCQEKLREVKQQLEEVKESAKVKKKSLKLFESVDKDLDIHFARLNDIVEKAKTVKEFEKQLEDLKSDISSKRSEIKASRSKLTGLKSDVESLSALLANLQLQREKTKSSMKETIRHLQEEKKSLEAQQSSEMAETSRAIKKMEAEVNDLIEENDRRNILYQKLYAEMMQKVRH
ncbi:hypothetical protein ONE63_007829 [Megalurothrips usitatus]|uniref:Kinetochore protein Nuf2 N-terminal domain-containing protein n=1 Tax=Megalurothrips usitatus TaxID=439358 RepID=A0AAV7XT60_9NEOP|nr:hypothetical protein ONE63_007829 [Megalurothrips usitatus]